MLAGATDDSGDDGLSIIAVLGPGPIAEIQLLVEPKCMLRISNISNIMPDGRHMIVATSSDEGGFARISTLEVFHYFNKGVKFPRLAFPLYGPKLGVGSPGRRRSNNSHIETIDS